MNILDIIIVFMLFIFMLHSYRDGFLDEALTLVIIGVSGYLAYILSPWLMPYLDFLSGKFLVLKITSILIIFTAFYIIGKIIKESLVHLTRETELNGIDKFLGMVIGLAKGIVVVSLLVFLVSNIKLNPFPSLLSHSLISNRILLAIAKYKYIVMI
ncbi:MAG: CvpA family protein [bacterium]|nr:CvpA family protein [bacterium]